MGSRVYPLLYISGTHARVRYECGSIMNELARAAELKPSTIERQVVPARFAPAENRVRPPPTGVDRVAACSQTRIVLQIILIIVAVAVGFWTLHRLASVVFVLVLAALFAYVVAPLVQLAGRPIRIAGRPRRLSRAAAIALVYVLIAGGVSGGAALLLPSATEQINDIVARAPAYAESLVSWEHGWSRYYERLRIPRELRQSIDQSALAAGQGAVQSIQGSLLALVGSLSYLPWLLLIPILAFFLLKDAATIRRTFIRALPHQGQLRGHRLFEELNTALAAYTRAQLLACVLVGVLCGVGFAILGIPYPVVLGALAGMLEFIPLVGPLVLAVVAATIGALHAPMLAVWAVGFLGVLRLIEDYVIYPRLIRHGIHLHPLVVILAVLAGAELGGIAGMFLAVPVAAIASVLYRHWVEWRRDDDLADETIPVARAQ
jgi:predicted PurR-regulated permease PerM